MSLLEYVPLFLESFLVVSAALALTTFDPYKRERKRERERERER